MVAPRVAVRVWLPLSSMIVAVVTALASLSGAAASGASCPSEMALIDGRYCIDRHEAAVELIDEGGASLGLHAHNRELSGARARAVSRAGVFPQGHISRDEAAAACASAGKRLCSDDEWVTACQGSEPTTYPYGPRFRSGMCNDEGISPLRHLHGVSYTHDYATLNDPRLALVAGSVARTGMFARCTSGNGVFDMVGNVHEWTASPTGVFRGGYFLDTSTLGEGCGYVTRGHAPTYRDYSTGFRCCAEVSP